MQGTSPLQSHISTFRQNKMYFPEDSMFSPKFNTLSFLLAMLFSIPFTWPTSTHSLSLGQTPLFQKNLSRIHKTSSGGLPTRPDSSYLTILLVSIYCQFSSLGCNFLEWLCFSKTSECGLTNIYWKTKWMRIQVKLSQKGQGIQDRGNV